LTALLQQSAVWRFGPSIFDVLQCGRCLKRAAMWPLYSACGDVAAVFSALLSSQHSAAGCSSSTELKKMNFQLFIFYPAAVLPLSAVMPLSPRPLRCSCLITLRISSRSCINLTPLRHYHCLGGGAPLFAYPAVKPEAPRALLAGRQRKGPQQSQLASEC